MSSPYHILINGYISIGTVCVLNSASSALAGIDLISSARRVCAYTTRLKLPCVAIYCVNSIFILCLQQDNAELTFSRMMLCFV